MSPATKEILRIARMYRDSDGALFPPKSAVPKHRASRRAYIVKIVAATEQDREYEFNQEVSS